MPLTKLQPSPTRVLRKWLRCNGTPFSWRLTEGNHKKATHVVGMSEKHPLLWATTPYYSARFIGPGSTLPSHQGHIQHQSQAHCQNNLRLTPIQSLFKNRRENKHATENTPREAESLAVSLFDENRYLPGEACGGFMEHDCGCVLLCLFVGGNLTGGCSSDSKIHGWNSMNTGKTPTSWCPWIRQDRFANLGCSKTPSRDPLN